MAMVYDLPTQSLGVSSAPKPQAFEAPEYKDYGSQQQMEAGKAALNIGSQMMIVAKDMENTIAEAATRERINTLESSVQEMLMNPESGYLTKLSKDAVDGSKPTLDSLGELDRKLGDGCKSELEKAMYRQHSGRILKAAKERIFGHHINQAKSWNLTEATKGLDNIANEQVMELSNDAFWNDPKNNAVPGAVKADGPSADGGVRFAKGATPAIMQSDQYTPQQKDIYLKAYNSGLRGIQFAESGDYKDPYSAKGRFVDKARGRAIGPYQIMEGFWDDFVKNAGMPKGTPRTPENEDYVAAVNWLKLMDKYKGDVWSAAIEWNTGAENAAKLFNGNTAVLQYKNDPKNAKSTVLDFATKVVNRMEQTQGSETQNIAAGRLSDIIRTMGVPEESETARNARRDYSSKIHLEVLKRKINEEADPAKIEAYINRNRKDIDQNALIPIEKSLLSLKGDKLGRQVWDQQRGSLTGADALPDDEVNMRAIESSTLPDPAKDQARSRYLSLSGQYKSERHNNELMAANDIYQMVNAKKPYADVVKAIDNSGLTSHGQINMRSFVNQQYGIEAPQDTAKKERKQKELTAFFNFQNDYVSGKLPTMQPQEVLAKYGPVLGEETDNAARLVAHVNAQSMDAKVTMEEMTAKLRVMSTNPAYKDLDLPAVDKLNDKGKAKLARLQSEVISLIAASAKVDPRKKMSVDAALAYALQKVTTEKGWFYDTKKPVYQLGTTEVGDIAGMSAEARSAFIGTEFYKKWGRMPNRDEVKVLDAKLTKGL
jgi:hypothetical protein